MAVYTTYQCSVCRRTKDVLQDNVRAAPNQCIITKGCLGSLFAIGVTSNPSDTAPVEGLTDWYPRGKKVSASPVAATQQSVSLSCSSTGVLTLAVRMTDAQATANPTLTMALTQRRVDDISYVVYNFKPSASTSTISGKDLTGKNLRFDQSAIDEGRVFVRLNGISIFPGDGITLTPNTVTFTTSVAAGSTVSVSVYSQQNTVSRTLDFEANYSFLVTSGSGSWGNVRWAEDYDDMTGAINPEKWWLYSCTSLGEIASSSRLILDTIFQSDGVTPLVTDFTTVRFLLSGDPHDNTDRYLNFYVDGVGIHDGYALSSSTATITELFADANVVLEIYPPMQLIKSTVMTNSSFVTADTFPTTTYSSDASAVRLSGTKIIGPV